MLIPILYVSSFYGFILIWGASQLITSIRGISDRAINTVISFIAAFIAISALAFSSKFRINSVLEREEELRRNLAKTFTLIRNKSYVDDSKVSELTQRFNRILTTEEDVGILDYYLNLFDHRVTTLTDKDRRILGNILERMQIKMANNNFDKDDLDSLEEMLENIEER